MRIFAFQGLRYRVPHPGPLAAPPYDQIDARTRDRLHEEPHQFSRLTRPVAGDGLAPHDHAAGLHRQWLAEGVIGVDDPPRLYAVEIGLPDGGRRLGLCVLVGLEAPGNGCIRPHEQTVDKTVAERLDLLRTLPVDLEPILLLADDGGALDELLTEDLDGIERLAVHRDAFGNEHRLAALAAGRTRVYRDALAATVGLIADGHHRYRTASLHAAEIAAPQGSPAACKLAVVTSLRSPALAIDPIHRALPRRLSPPLPERGVRSRRALAILSGREIAEAVAGGGPTALGVATREGIEIWALDPAAGPESLPPAASRLAVVLLHETLLPQWGYLAADAVNGTLRYRSDPEALYEAVRAGETPVGLFLPPMTPEGFHGAIANGDILPPKSTRFLPKVVSGLVWSSHDGRLG